MTDRGPAIAQGSWAVGGGLLLGLGVEFFFLRESALYFVGSRGIGGEPGWLTLAS